jgi:ATP-dependent DNA helicase DinG
VTSTLDSLVHGASSTFANIRKNAFQADGASPILAAVVKAEEEAERTEAIATSFFSFVKDLEPLAERSTYDRVDIWVNDEIRDSGPWSVVAHTGKALVQHLNVLIGECKEVLALLDASSADFADARADLFGLCGHLFDIHESIALCIDGSDEEYAFSAHLNRREERRDEMLSASLLDVGRALIDGFYPRMLSVIYTSATIATGKSFDHFAHAVGLDLLDADAWSTLQLESCYDFERNMTVLVPTDISEPRATGYSGQLRELLLDVHRAMGGSVLTLFTNRREMEQMYETLQPLLAAEGLELLCQKRGVSAKRLRDGFLEHVGTSLFALRSFWEGFDAPGDTLRCVVVPRLPFGRPNDPLFKERERHDAQAWKHYQLPEAVLDLKQAAGRLIRTSTDTGFLVLADSRLVTKWYGQAFLQALPSQNQLRVPLEDVAPSIQRRL